ncbi:MAG TPA: hypothetical protein VHW24_14905, partial [Bryobacteraceae bacterium]|nr:hypothetical protein [Bryobacteraceae bacterium]
MGFGFEAFLAEADVVVADRQVEDLVLAMAARGGFDLKVCIDVFDDDRCPVGGRAGRVGNCAGDSAERLLSDRRERHGKTEKRGQRDSFASHEPLFLFSLWSNYG